MKSFVPPLPRKPVVLDRAACLATGGALAFIMTVGALFFGMTAP